MGQPLNNIGVIYSNKGDYDKALDYYEKSLAIREEMDDKSGIRLSLHNIGLVYYYKGDYVQALKYSENSLAIKKEIGVKGNKLETITSLYITYKYLGKEYDEKQIHKLIKESENIDFDDNLKLYELLEDKSYLETAYNQIQEKVDAIDEELKKKFLNYPIPKQIIEEYNKVYLN